SLFPARRSSDLLQHKPRGSARLHELDAVGRDEDRASRNRRSYLDDRHPLLARAFLVFLGSPLAGREQRTPRDLLPTRFTIRVGASPFARPEHLGGGAVEAFEAAPIVVDGRTAEQFGQEVAGMRDHRRREQHERGSEQAKDASSLHRSIPPYSPEPHGDRHAHRPANANLRAGSGLVTSATIAARITHGFAPSRRLG